MTESGQTTSEQSAARRASGRAAGQRLISVVVPVYCEEEIVPRFHARATAAMAALAPAFDYELVFVNDGSTDRTLARLLEIRERDPRVKIIDFSRNFGHQIAITAGMDHACGDAVVAIDGDLQDPPEVIPRLVAKWQEGNQVVYGKRLIRRNESAFKRVAVWTFYRIIRRLSDTPLPLDTGDFRLLDRCVVDAVASMREENRYIRGLVSWVGYQQAAVEYEREGRYAGQPKYTLTKLVRLAFDGITSFSEKPLHISSYIGVCITLAAFGLMLWIVANKLLAPAKSIDGYTSTMAVILFFGGIQLLSLGVIGQYLGRIYREVKDRPLYIVRSRHGLD